MVSNYRDNNAYISLSGYYQHAAMNTQQQEHVIVQSVPALTGLAVPGLTLPGLTLPGLALPGLVVPGLVVPG